MSGLSVTLLYVVLVLGATLYVARRPGFRWTFLSGSLMSMVLYASHVIIGVALFLLLFHAHPEGKGGLAMALAGWIALGCVDLVRIVPRNAEPPRVLMSPGIVDVVCLAVIATGLALAWHA